MKIGLISFALIAIIVILPILPNVTLCYSDKGKKMYFSVSLWLIDLVVLKGYITIDSKGIYLHYSNKNAMLIPYKKMMKSKRKPYLLKSIIFHKINTNLRYTKTNEFISVLWVECYVVILKCLNGIIKTYNQNAKINAKITCDKVETFSYLLNVSFEFCILGIIINYVKYLMGNNIWKMKVKSKV